LVQNCFILVSLTQKKSISNDASWRDLINGHSGGLDQALKSYPQKTLLSENHTLINKSPIDFEIGNFVQ
jgi:hypothetical protein